MRLQRSRVTASNFHILRSESHYSFFYYSLHYWAGFCDDEPCCFKCEPCLCLIGQKFVTCWDRENSASKFGEVFQAKLSDGVDVRAKRRAGKPTLHIGFPQRRIKPQKPSASRKKMLPVVGIEPGYLALWSWHLFNCTIIAFGSLIVFFGFVARALALDFGSMDFGLWFDSVCKWYHGGSEQATWRVSEICELNFDEVVMDNVYWICHEVRFVGCAEGWNCLLLEQASC